VHRRHARPHQGQAQPRSEMLSRSLPRLSNLKALFPPRPRDGGHQPGEIASGTRAGRRAHDGHGDALILQALSSVGWPQEWEEPVAARFDARVRRRRRVGFVSLMLQLMSTRKARFADFKIGMAGEHRPRQRSSGTLHLSDVWEGSSLTSDWLTRGQRRSGPACPLRIKARMRRSLMKRSDARSPGEVLPAGAREPLQPLTGEQPEERDVADEISTP
jgi:hypothetical protein